MSAILAKVKRKKVVESIHRGYIAVVNSQNKVIYKKGDINRITYIRSSAKPIQALNVILSGAYKHFGFSTQELALMCSSHFAEKKHIEILEKFKTRILKNNAGIQVGKIEAVF
ncbi:MAG: asparaginase [Candidatus Mcinerneyibacterium aminivorans]|uniref:Asparaginase n=1 Tax=Candidatus Mcinerneyibacterium aminivorans TaxID=2703815 RepID=A0A5D0MLJ3_9BACT|nr:MAG: asparaginase [Candidatus Mcinerneyibacterium aminivorans]